MATRMVSALPFIATLVQKFKGEVLADFIDYAAICATLDPDKAPEALYYLQKIRTGGYGEELVASAEVEIATIESAG